MVLFGALLLYSGLVSSIVFGSEPHSLSSHTRTSYAHGNVFGCSNKFYKPYCWRYCDGGDGKWCYTVMNTFDGHGICHDDYDCRYNTACQGWCAWNSQKGCAKSCHEEVVVQESPKSECRRGRAYWQCQSSFGSGWRSGLAAGGKWISPDISNEEITNRTMQKTLALNGNIAALNEDSKNGAKSALWFPIGKIRSSFDTFYWTFTIRQPTATTSTSNIQVGISDLNKLAAGWGTRGLFYGGNLSDGSKLLIGKFGPPLKHGDKVSFFVKIVDSRIKVYIILNDKSLGLAYDVPEKTLDGIYPAVTFESKGVVEIKETDIATVPIDLEPVKPLNIEGNWSLITLGNDKTFVKHVTVKLSETKGRVFRLRMHILNKFMGKLVEKSTSNWAGEINDKTDSKGTREEMELETRIVKHIAGVKNLRLDHEKNELQLESGDYVSVWKQVEAKRSTVDWDPFAKGTN